MTTQAFFRKRVHHVPRPRPEVMLRAVRWIGKPAAHDHLRRRIVFEASAELAALRSHGIPGDPGG